MPKTRRWDLKQVVLLTGLLILAALIHVVNILPQLMSRSVNLALAICYLDNEVTDRDLQRFNLVR
jgi:hypothetical protein